MSTITRVEQIYLTEIPSTLRRRARTLMRQDPVYLEYRKICDGALDGNMHTVLTSTPDGAGHRSPDGVNGSGYLVTCVELIVDDHTDDIAEAGRF